MKTHYRHMTNDTALTDMDRLERIYARVMPKTSPAFEDRQGCMVSGGTGGALNASILDKRDYLNAIGQAERYDDLGGSLLRATFTDDLSCAVRIVKGLILRGFDSVGARLAKRDNDLISAMLVHEHVNAYTLLTCKACKGRGVTRSNSGKAITCVKCDGRGSVKYVLKTYTRFKSLSGAGSSIGRRKWERDLEPIYLQWLDMLAEQQNITGAYLLKILKKPS